MLGESRMGSLKVPAGPAGTTDALLGSSCQVGLGVPAPGACSKGHMCTQQATPCTAQQQGPPNKPLCSTCCAPPSARRCLTRYIVFIAHAIVGVKGVAICQVDAHFSACAWLCSMRRKHGAI